MGTSVARAFFVRFSSIGASLTALAVSSLFAASAAAQESPPDPDAAPAEAAADSQEIIVTGSRLARTTFDTPNPVTVLGGEDFDRLSRPATNVRWTTSSARFPKPASAAKKLSYTPLPVAYPAG